MPAKYTLSYTKSICVNRNNQYSYGGNKRQALPFWHIVFIHVLYISIAKHWASPGRAQAGTGIWLRALKGNLLFA